MTLIVIYGPPAAGKLTIANELNMRTGSRVFHNHLTIDCVKPVFEFGTAPFNRLTERIRAEIIAEAAREGVDLIHTFVYAFGEDDDYFYRQIAACEENGGAVHLVLLRCGDEERRKRIVSDSRKSIGKLTDPASIELSRERYDLESPLPGRESLIIDTAAVSASEAAELIIEKFGLRTI